MEALAPHEDRRENLAGKAEAGWGKVVDEVLHPGEVGVALGRQTAFPAHVVLLAEPIRVVEWGGDAVMFDGEF